MQKFSLLPMYAIGLDEISDGLSVKCTKYCKKNRNTKCQKYYQDLFNSDKEGLHKCPYGFNSYIIFLNNEIEIFTGFRLENKYDRKKTSSKITRDDRNHIISDQDLENYVTVYKNYFEMKQKQGFSAKFIESSFHDIRAFNTHIKTKSDIIARKVESKAKNKLSKQVNDLSRNIWAMSNFISNKLNSYDVISAETPNQLGVEEEWNSFKILDKIRICFKDDCNEKHVTLKLDCNTSDCENVKTHNTLELLLFLITENAVKYSKKYSEISMYINDSKSEIQTIEIKSISPRLNSDEMDRIYEYGFRGNGAQKLDVDGSGIGMHISDKICKLSGIKIETTSSDYIKATIDKIDYSCFSVKLTINKDVK